MDNNELLMIVLAFVVGYMCSGMMKQMCGGRLVEGVAPDTKQAESQVPHDICPGSTITPKLLNRISMTAWNSQSAEKRKDACEMITDDSMVKWATENDVCDALTTRQIAGQLCRNRIKSQCATALATDPDPYVRTKDLTPARCANELNVTPAYMATIMRKG